MASRGTVAKNGHIGTSEYETLSVTNNGVKILKGSDKSHHSLPDYAHTPESIYAKLKPDGTLHEIRFYDSKGAPIIEIAFHPEPKINNGDRKTSILHFHLYHGLERGEAVILETHLDIKQKYAKYLEEFGFYD